MELDTSLIEVNQLMTQEELDNTEVIIEKGKQTFIEVGNALREIRDSKGYRLKYGTFEEYCKQRWNFSVQHGRRLINSSDTANTLIQNGTPGFSLTEKQVRPITTLNPEQQISFAESHDIAEMTSREVERAVKEYKAKLSDAEQRIASIANDLSEYAE